MKITGDIESVSFVVSDTETTGLEPVQAELTEIGAIKLIGRDEVDRFSSLIKPVKPIPEFISELTGITDELVKDSADSTTVFKKYLEFLGDSVFVAHNVSFDLKFLKAEAVKAEIDFPDVPMLCTLELSRRVLSNVGRYSLGNLCKTFNIEMGSAHRAIVDVEATVKLLWLLLDKIRENGKTLADYGY